MSSVQRYVIIADDDKDDITLLEEAFKRRQIREELVKVHDGSELLAYLQGVSEKGRWPQLILLDLNMPHKDGRETLAELKQHATLKKIPVVIYSTSNDQEEIKACYEMGANSYVVKPSEFDKLLHTVDVIHAYWCKTVSVAV
jgi:CheY-like chemotaxis protein